MDIEYYFDLVNMYYGTRTAKRSGVPLILHIVEGLLVLDSINASDDAKKAFCIHPLFQSNEALFQNRNIAKAIDPDIMMLVMEYRKTANAYLSHRTINNISEIELSLLKDVNDMLIADKVQNYKDFIRFHKGIHPRSSELDEYFNNWFKRLNVKFSELFTVCYKVAVTIRLMYEGKTLLLDRHPYDTTYRGKCLPGGKVECGEDIISAIHRELKEETGIVLTDELTYFDTYFSHNLKGTISVVTFECNMKQLPEIVLNEYEIAGYNWVNEAEWNNFWFT